MTTSAHIPLAANDASRSRALVRRLAEPVLAVLLFALVSGAWLAFFVFVPFDWTITPR